jgi:3-oxoacyl-[acyl-carrier protein] reductase
VAADVKAAGGEAALIKGDVMIEDDVKRIVRETAAAFGRIDVLVNNAGGMLGRVKIEDYTVEHINRVLSLNCTQVALFMREAIPHHAEAEVGQRHQRDVDRRRATAAARGDSLRRRQGLRLDGDPRLGEGGRRRRHPRERAVARRHHDAVPRPLFDRRAVEGDAGMIPMNRLGGADECAGTLLFLASDALSGYVTGQVVEVNGGQYMP